MRILITILLFFMLTGCVYEPPYRHAYYNGPVTDSDGYRVVQTFTGPMVVPVEDEEAYPVYNSYTTPVVYFHGNLNLWHWRGHREHGEHEYHEREHREHHEHDRH